MRSWGVVLALWLGLSIAAPAHAASAADAVLEEVSSALAAGQYEDAVTVAGSGMAEPGLADVTRSRLLIVRGLARQALGANDDALADFTQSLSISALPPQERARALFARGVSLDSLDRLESALGDYSAVLRLSPGAPHALNNRANVYRRQGRIEDARRDYMAALKSTNPNPQYPYFGLGQIAEAEGKPEVARGYYDKALVAAPGFALALERLQAMGIPVEGPAGLPAAAGVIVLKPPGAKSAPDAPVTPPQGPAPAVPQQPVIAASTAPAPRNPVPVAVDRGAPLRPTIVEGATHPDRKQAQLGAWRSEQEARDGWAVARDAAGGLLDGLAPAFVRADIGSRGTFWRLRVSPTGPVPQFCAGLVKRGLACIPARD